MPEIPVAGFSRRGQGVFITPPAGVPNTSVADAQVAAQVSDAAFEIADFAIKKLEKKREDEIQFLINSEAVEVRPALTKIQNDMESEAKKNDEPFSDVAFKQAANAYRESRLENIVDEDVRKAVGATIDRRAAPFIERGVNLSAADKDRFLLRSLGDIRKNNLKGFNEIPLDAISDAEGSPDPKKISETMLDYFRVVTSASDALRSAGLSSQDEHDSFSRETTDTFLRRFFNEGTSEQIKVIEDQLGEGVYNNVYNDSKKISNLIGEARRAQAIRGSKNISLDKDARDQMRLRVNDAFSTMISEAEKGRFVPIPIDTDLAISIGAVTKTQIGQLQRKLDLTIETRDSIEINVLKQSKGDINKFIQTSESEFEKIKKSNASPAKKEDARLKLEATEAAAIRVLDARQSDPGAQVRLEYSDELSGFEKRLRTEDDFNKVLSDRANFLMDKMDSVFESRINLLSEEDAQTIGGKLVLVGGDIDGKIKELTGLIRLVGGNEEAMANIDLQLQNRSGVQMPFSFSTMLRFIMDENAAGVAAWRDVMNRSLVGQLDSDLKTAASRQGLTEGQQTDATLENIRGRSNLSRDIERIFVGQGALLDEMMGDALTFSKGLLINNPDSIKDPSLILDRGMRIMMSKYERLDLVKSGADFRIHKKVMSDLNIKAPELRAMIDIWIKDRPISSILAEPAKGADPGEGPSFQRNRVWEQIQDGRALLVWNETESKATLKISHTNKDKVTGFFTINDKEGKPIELIINKKFVEDIRKDANRLAKEILGEVSVKRKVRPLDESIDIAKVAGF